MLKIHNRICLIALAFLAVLCFSITVNASGGPSSGSSGTATVGAIDLSYKWDSTYYPFVGYDSVRKNGNASVNWNDTDDTFSLSATSATYKNYYISQQYAQDVSAECTITNNTGNVLEISYSKDASVRVAVSNGTLNGEKIVLENTGTITLLVITETKHNNTSAVNVSGTFKITSCNAVTSYNVKMQPSPFGNYSFAVGTATGSIAAGGSNYVTTANRGLEVSCAVPTILDAYKEDYYFYGWSVNGMVTASKSAYSGTISTHTTILPVFLKNGEETDGGPFLVNGKRYIFWANAIKAAGNQYPVVIARDDYKLPATIQEQGAGEADGVYFVEANGSISYNIPSGVVVLVPFDDVNTLITDMSSEVTEVYEAPVEYRKLILESGTKITVASGGVLCVGSRAYRQASGQTGAHGSIELERDSEIIVDGTLYAWGYIFGDGVITANTGSSVYQMLFAPDYPNSASTAVDLKKAMVFPMRVYSWQNVEVPLTVKYGSTLYGFYHVYGSNAGNHPGTVKIFGTGTDAVFQMTKSGSEATASFSEGKQKVILKGEFAFNSLSVTVSVYFVITYTETISTSNAQGLPLPGHFDITLKSGAKVVSNENIIITKGAKITIEENATFDANGKNLYVLDASDDPGPPASAGLAGYTVYLKDRYGIDYSKITEDATIIVNGTLKASGGFYTSAGGANIISTGNGKIEVTGTSTETSVVLKANQGGSTSITISPAKLKNGASSESGYTNTAGSNTYYYCLSHEQWSTDNHKAVVTITQPTCKTEGSVVASCGTKSRLVETIAKAPHVWNVQTQGENKNVHTCACAYGCTTNVVLNLEFRLDDYLWFNGYTAEGYLTDPADGVTVSDNIQTIVANNVRYFVKAIPADEIPDELTFTISVSGGTATFTVSLEDYVVPASQEKLKAALLAYGAAAKDYFDGNETLENGHVVTGNPTDSNNTVSTTGAPVAWNGATLETTGANIYFDEALRLGISYNLSTIPSGYKIAQIGLLVGKLSENNLTLENKSMAYLLFNSIPNGTVIGGETIENDVIGLYPDNGPWDTANDVITMPDGTFAAPTISSDGKTGTIIFDLAAQDYKTMFAIRPVIVFEKDGTYVCVYGRQIGYGLEAYINGVYDSDKSTDEYKYLLEMTWALAGVTSPVTGG